MTAHRTVSDIKRDVLSRLEDTKEHRGYWTAICPSHDDHDPSLTVREHEDGVSVKCHAGCSTEDIVRAVGLEKQDLFPSASLELKESPNSKISENYYYRDAQGNSFFRVRRMPSKKFIQQRFDVDSGR